MPRPRTRRPPARALVLEQGDVYFLVQPKVETQQVRRLADVQRTLMLLRPAGGDRYRRVLLGHKRLPRAQKGRRERYWSYIDRVGAASSALDGLEPHTYVTQTRGERFQPGAKLVGAGRYVLEKHGTHTHFGFELDPLSGAETPQEMIGLSPRGSFLLLAMRPRLGERGSEQWHSLPDELKALFGEKRFADPPLSLLDREGTNLVLVPVRHLPHVLRRLRVADEGLPGDAWVTGVPERADLQLALELRVPQL